jgi:hypothetical protein
MPEQASSPPIIDIFATGRWVTKQRVPVDRIRTWHITILAQSLACKAPPPTESEATSNAQSDWYRSLATSLIRDQLKSAAWRATIFGLAYGDSKSLRWTNHDQITNLAESIAATARKYLRWNPDPEEQHYRRCMVSEGIAWCCQVLEYEGSLEDPERFPRLDAEEARG